MCLHLLFLLKVMIEIHIYYCVHLHQICFDRFLVYVYGEPFQAWEMWPSPDLEKPVGSEVGGQDPRPRIDSPMVGNQVFIVPRPL